MVNECHLTERPQAFYDNLALVDRTAFFRLQDRGSMILA
jgi:hypothetical protein